MAEQEPVDVQIEASEQPQPSGEKISRREFLDRYGKPVAIGVGLTAVGSGGLWGLLRLAARISENAAAEEERRLREAREAAEAAARANTPVSTPVPMGTPVSTNTPSPTATPKPPEPTLTLVPFGPPETGEYNAEALASWTEIEPQPKLDKRIGISILPSRVVRGPGTVEWHATVAERLGFQRVAIVLSPPEHQNHTGIETPPGLTITQLAREFGYDRIFANPAFKDLHVTCDVGRTEEAADGWQFPQGEFTEAELQATYDEYREFAEWVLNNFGHLGKEITIGGPNEMELLCKGGYDPSTEDADISPVAVKNAIAYYSAFYRAVRDANEAHPGATPLRTGIEVLQIRETFTNEEARNGLTAVVPGLIGSGLAPDEVTLSAWQFANKGGTPGYWMSQAVSLMSRVAPESKVAITEYGLADSEWIGLTREQVAEMYRADLEAAWQAGATYAMIWGLTGFDANANFPDNDGIRGLGLVRPDASIRKEIYNVLRAMSGVAAVA